jgi:hypothetical protein
MLVTSPYLSPTQTTKIDGHDYRLSVTAPAPVTQPIGLLTKAAWVDPQIAASCPPPIITGAEFVGP